MRWPTLDSQTSSSSSYLPVYEDDNDDDDEEYFHNNDNKNVGHKDRSKLARVLRGLACWKSTNKQDKSTTMDDAPSLALLAGDDDDVATALRQTSLQSPSLDGIPPLEHALHYNNEKQDIFVSKANNVSLWKKWWRTLSCKQQQQQPLACQEDSNSTTDSTSQECEDYPGAAAATMASPHFSVSSNTRRLQRTAATTTTTPRTLASFSSDTMLGEFIETEWPMLHVPQSNHVMAKCLQIYTDRRQLDCDDIDNDDDDVMGQPPLGTPKPKSKRVVDFDRVSPMSDSASVNAADLGVSFDNQQECAQLIFQSWSRASDYSDDDNVHDNLDLPSPPPSLGAQYPHPVPTPKVPSVERQYVWLNKDSLSSSSCATTTMMQWNTDTSPILMEPSPLSCGASVEVSLTDYYENNVGWSSSHDEANSIASLLSSSSKVFQPICRYETTNPTESLLFVPPSYFAGCFTDGPTLLPDDKVHHDEKEESLLLTTPKNRQQDKSRTKHSMFFL